MEKDQIVKNDTCFSAHMRYGVSCKKIDCKYWMPCEDSQNCSLVASATGNMTLEKIGQIFELTRMRVCQIEKNIFKKVLVQLKDHRSL